jgi:hypothetical protein
MEKTRNLAIILILLLLIAPALYACQTTEPTPLPEPVLPAAETPQIAGPEITEPEAAIFVPGDNDIIINPGSEWELEGILTLPDGKSPFPVVIFSAYNNKNGGGGFFRDLAELLRAQGIACIRYDERTFAYDFLEMDVNLTYKESNLYDVLSAAALAKTIEEIDPDMIFVAGFSIQGFFIPKIDEEDTKDMITGYVFMRVFTYI